MSTALALDLTQRLTGLACCLAALEGIAARLLLPGQGLLSWRISRLRDTRTIVGWQGGVLGALLGGSRIWATLGARAALGAALALTVAPVPSAIAAGLLVVLGLALHFAVPQGSDGSDQIALIVVTAVLVARVSPPDSAAQHLCLAFVAGQLALAYCASGVAKLLGSAWRSGRAVGEILSTRTYGSPGLARIVERLPIAGTAATYATVALETAFPAALFLPQPALTIALVAFLGFHLSVAVSMGLNSFVPAFVATYPAALWAQQALHG